MVLAAPEFVETKRVDLFDEIEVAAELQQRILADRMMRREKSSEFQACHAGFSPDLLLFGIVEELSGAKLRGGAGQGNPPSPPPAHGCRAGLADIPSPGIIRRLPITAGITMNRVLIR
jgi:hypothetical protein